MSKEFKTTSSMEYNDTGQLSMIIGREEAAVEKRGDMLRQSSVILDTGQSAHAPNFRKQRPTGETVCGARAGPQRRHLQS